MRRRKTLLSCRDVFLSGFLGWEVFLSSYWLVGWVRICNEDGTAHRLVRHAIRFTGRRRQWVRASSWCLDDAEFDSSFFVSFSFEKKQQQQDGRRARSKCAVTLPSNATRKISRKGKAKSGGGAPRRLEPTSTNQLTNRPTKPCFRFPHTSQLRKVFSWNLVSVLPLSQPVYTHTYICIKTLINTNWSSAPSHTHDVP